MSGLDSIAVADDDAIAEQRIRRCSAVWGWGIGLGIVVGWEIFTRLKIIDPYFFSSPMTIVSTFYVAATQGTLYLDIGYTSAATIVGFLIGVTSGALLGLSTWWSQIYGRVSEPYLVTFNAIPKLALAPILIIIFGIGFESKVALAVALTIVPAAMAACGGVKSVDKDLETLLFSLGARRFQVFAKVVVPWAMPWIVSSLRVNIGLALAGAIVGEFIASRFGVGRMILYAGQIMDINLVWVGVVVLSILALVMYAAVTTAERYLLKGMLHGSQPSAH
ncbi:MAG: ABC transporter permease [Xanthobacteraceae bacterium]|jgi:NitT/TauT family transport system permease protein